AAFEIAVNLAGIRKSSKTALVEQVAGVKHNATFSVEHIQAQASVDHGGSNALALRHHARRAVFCTHLRGEVGNNAVVGRSVYVPIKAFVRRNIELGAPMETGVR